MAAATLEIGSVLRAQRRLAEALAEHRRALALLEGIWGPEHPHVARARHELAVTLATLGRHAEALPLLERALAVRAHAAPPLDLAATRFALAQALRATGRDPERAGQLAKGARDVFAAAGAVARVRQEAVERWLLPATAR